MLIEMIPDVMNGGYTTCQYMVITGQPCRLRVCLHGLDGKIPESEQAFI